MLRSTLSHLISGVPPSNEFSSGPPYLPYTARCKIIFSPQFSSRMQRVSVLLDSHGGLCEEKVDFHRSRFILRGLSSSRSHPPSAQVQLR